MPASELVVRKSVLLRGSPGHAFRVFTAGIAGWWPLDTHSIAGEQALSCAIEPRVGGRVFERASDGAEHIWGTITVWEPPHRLAMTWHPGRPAEQAQRVEITFRDDSGRVRVDLVHSGFEVLGQSGAETYASYDGGWETVLCGRFATEASRSAAVEA